MSGGVLKKKAVKTPAKSAVVSRAIPKKVPKSPVAKKAAISKKEATKKAPTTKIPKKTVEKQVKVSEVERLIPSPLKIKAEKTFFTPREERQPVSTEEVVELPNAVSLRVKNKVKAIANLIPDDLTETAIKVSFVAGIVFVLFGGVVAATNTTSLVSYFPMRQLASLTSSTAEVGSLPQTISVTVNAELVSVDHQIPTTLLQRDDFTVTTMHAESMKVRVILPNGDTRDMTAASPSSNTFRFTLDPAEYGPGLHRVHFLIKGLNGSITTTNEVGAFMIPPPPMDPVIELRTQVPSPLTANFNAQVFVKYVQGVNFVLIDRTRNNTKINLPKTLANEPDTFMVQIPGATMMPGNYEFRVEFVTSDSTTPKTAKLADIQIPTRTAATDSSVTDSGSAGGTSTDDAEEIADDTEAETDTASSTTEAEELAAPVFKEPVLRLPTNTFEKSTTVSIHAPLESTQVTVFLRKEMSTTRTKLGTAIRGENLWLFFVNIKDIPNGTYYLTADVQYQGKLYFSRAEKITVKVPLTTTLVSQPATQTTTAAPPLPAPDTTGATNEVDTDTAESTEEVGEPVETEDRPFVATDDASLGEGDDSEQEADDAALQTRQLFDAYKKDFDRLLRNYALAVQSGDRMLIDAARRELQKLQDELYNKALLDPGLRILADSIRTKLSEKISSLQQKVETFEELRKRDTNQESAVDSDGDGISDQDERVLFKTDPQVADSDGDGVSDGVEIIKGYNPLDDSPEALVVYESPKESVAYIDGEVLLIETVVPVIRKDISEEKPPVAAEVRGKGIPNSFVTLYIFSTPVVVTVKTDADGSFVYTFEDELEDGEHEVYVAVTDNAGAIVAQSNPFRFIKEAEAFTPQGEDVVPPMTTTIETGMSDNPYVAAVGLGILGFGLILLMLGLGLREQKVLTISQENAPA